MKTLLRFLCAALAAMLVASFSIIAPSAAEPYTTDPAPWDGKTIAASFAYGDGSEKNPFVIASAAQLAYFGKAVNDGALAAGSRLILACDIDLGGNEWTPVGTLEFVSFIGFFDGCGHTISNFKITTCAAVALGLFGYLTTSDTAVQNLKIEYAEITALSSGTCAGALTGYLQGGAYAAGIIVSDTVTVNNTSNSTAGIAGRVITGAVLEYCVNNATVSVSSGGSSVFVGGITAVVGSGATIRYCVNNGKISNMNSGDPAVIKFYTGGVSGIMGAGGSGGLIENCYNNGEVTSNVAAGGVSGFTNTVGNAISDSYNASDKISGDPLYAGSIFGRITNPLTATGCAGVPVAGLGQYGTSVAATQTDFSGLVEGKSADIKVKTDAIDAKIAAELARLAAIVYTLDPGSLSETTEAPVTTAPVTAAPVTTVKATEAPVTSSKAGDDTASPSTEAPGTDPADSKGCGSSSALALIPALLAAAFVMERKKFPRR